MSSKKSEALEQLDNYLPSTKQQIRWNNLILIVMTVLSVTFFTYINFIWDPAAGVSDSKLMEAAVDQVIKDADEIIVEGTTLAVKATPPVTDALYHQAKEDMPVYLSTLEKEGEVMADNLKESLAKKLKAQFKKYLQKHRNILREEIPEVGGDKAVNQLTADFEKAMEKLIERYYLKEFAQQTKRTKQLWQQFRPVKRLSDGKTLEENLLRDLPKWAALRLIDYGEEKLEKKVTKKP